jgi:hypothetical protein
LIRGLEYKSEYRRMDQFESALPEYNIKHPKEHPSDDVNSLLGWQSKYGKNNSLH